MKACVTSPDWLNKSHSFFSGSFLLAKESETFIFLGIFWNLLVQSFGCLFCENNHKWPKTKHCFDNFHSSDTFDSRGSKYVLANIQKCKDLENKNMRIWQPRPQSNFKKLVLAPHDFAGNFCLIWFAIEINLYNAVRFS